MGIFVSIYAPHRIEQNRIEQMYLTDAILQNYTVATLKPIQK